MTLKESTKKLLEESAAKEQKERGEIFEVDPDFQQAKPPEGYMRLDLACGGSKKDGFVGIDRTYNNDWGYAPNEFIEADLNSPNWNIKENSVSDIHCSHFIEHVADIKDFMRQCYNILIPNGILHIVAPYHTAIGAWQDFTHVRAISEHTFLYFHQPWMIANKLTHYDVKCDFDIRGIKYYFNPEWQPKSSEAQEFARKHYFNVVSEILVDMIAIKPMRGDSNA